MKENLLVCPVCRGALGAFEEKLHCASCKSTYPFLRGTVPVLIADAYAFMTHAYLQYGKFLAERKVEAQKLTAVVNSGYDRTTGLAERLHRAYQTNDNIIQKIADTLETHLSTSHIRDAYLNEKAAPLAYMVNNIYLIRDWGQIPGGDSEIAHITEHIAGALAQSAPDTPSDSDAILFLGAGMGRVACEVAGLVPGRMFALDNSVTMAYMADEVRRNDIPFFEINLKNVETPADMVVEHVASVRACRAGSDAASRVQYLVGDASKLPFPDNSLTAVASVFFTDVLPLPILIKEVKRVLKPGGIFIHYGPLEYHHEDVRFMFSLEETMQMFARQHFDVSDYQTFWMPHCQVLQTGMFKTYRSWLFRAAKRSLFHHINGSTRLSIARDMEFYQNGAIGNGVYRFDTSLVLGVNDIYEGADTVLDMLKIIQTGKSFEEMIGELSVEYGEIGAAEKEQIKRILAGLADKGVLLIDNPQQV